MKKLIGLLILTAGICFVPGVIRAAECTYSEKTRVSTLASNVNSNYTTETRKTSYYEPFTGENIEEEQKYFLVNIFNIVEDLRAEVTNKTTGGVTEYTSANAAEGVITIEVEDPYVVTEYSVVIYANSGDCAGTSLRTMTIRTPRLNEYYNRDVCREYPEFSLCREVLTTDYETSEIDFKLRLDDYIKELEEKEAADKENAEKANIFGTIIDFVVEYWYYFVSGGIIVGTVVTIIVITKTRRRDI